MEGCRTANPWDFLSKPSFKITAKGKRHRNEPMARDFEEIVRPTPAEPQSTQVLDGRRLSVDHGEHRHHNPTRSHDDADDRRRVIGGRRKKLDTAIWREIPRLYDISQPTMSRIVALHRTAAIRSRRCENRDQE